MKQLLFVLAAIMLATTAQAKKVKVTILATGFGIEDVDGMNAHLGKKHTQEEALRIAEEEEKKAARDDRRKRYYNDDPNHSQKKRRKQIFLFRMEDLDNEDVILSVENTPTYKRTRQMLEDISNQALMSFAIGGHRSTFALR